MSKAIVVQVVENVKDDKPYICPFGNQTIEVVLPSGNKVKVLIPVDYLEEYYDLSSDNFIFGLNMVTSGHYE